MKQHEARTHVGLLLDGARQVRRADRSPATVTARHPVGAEVAIRVGSKGCVAGDAFLYISCTKMSECAYRPQR